MTEVYSLCADVTQTSSSIAYKLGTCLQAEGGEEYMYVLTSGAVTSGDTVVVDENFTARSITTTLAAAAQKVGFAQNAIATDTYGWVATKGNNVSGRIADNSTADAPLYTTATAGVLSTDASTADPVKIDGVELITAVSGGGACSFLATYPTIVGA